MSNTALILVDIQNDYFPGGKFPLVGIEAAAANAARLLKSARQSGDLIVHVRHVAKSAEAPFFVPGSEGANINSAVCDRDGELVIVKRSINAFRDTELKAVLDRHQVQSVVIAGAMSHMCIDAVTRAAVDYGFSAIIIHDAAATRDLTFDGLTVPAAQVHAAQMAALQFGYAKIVSTDEFLNFSEQAQAAA